MRDPHLALFRTHERLSRQVYDGENCSVLRALFNLVLQNSHSVTKNEMLLLKFFEANFWLTKLRNRRKMLKLIRRYLCLLFKILSLSLVD